MRRIVLSVFLLTWCFAASGQIRHVKGIKSVEVNFGKPLYGTAFGASFVKYRTSSSYWKVGLLRDVSKRDLFQINSTAFDFSYYYTVYDINEIVYFNLFGGATVAVDQLVQNEFYSAKSAFKYGVLGGAEVEVFITDKWAVVPGFNQRYLFVDTFGKTRHYITFSVRYSF
jgi:hypothetical protein